MRAVMRVRHQREQPRSHQYPDSSAYPPSLRIAVLLDEAEGHGRITGNRVPTNNTGLNVALAYPREAGLRFSLNF